MESGDTIYLLRVGGQMNLAEVVQALVAAIGFIVVCYQIFHLIRSIHGVTQDNLYSHYTEIGKCFLDKPYLYPYFYENKEINEHESANPHLREEIALMSEAILSLIEHAVMQKNNLPGDSWKSCWLPYARERIAKSVEIKKFFDPNQGWYTDALREVVDTLMRQSENPGYRREWLPILRTCRSAMRIPTFTRGFQLAQSLNAARRPAPPPRARRARPRGPRPG